MNHNEVMKQPNQIMTALSGMSSKEEQRAKYVMNGTPKNEDQPQLALEYNQQHCNDAHIRTM